MKKNYALLLLMLCVMLFANQAKAQDYPLNFDKDDLQDYFEGNDLWTYMAAAFEGTVKQVETNDNKTPFVLVDMDGEEIWMSCYFELSDVDLKSGDKIKTLGFFKYGNGREKTLNELNDSDFYFMAVGLYNLSEDIFVCSDHSEDFCDDWRYEGVFQERRP
ncbi:MAG: hypothetical protein U5Q03_02925 [Bacteroidota bacterium]|nr:hypothetical protein [Bacteroidota bacterium]